MGPPDPTGGEGGARVDERAPLLDKPATAGAPSPARPQSRTPRGAQSASVHSWCYNADRPFPRPPPLAPPHLSGAVARDAYLDNCKFALMLLIGVGHALQWLLATEDARVGREWCASDRATEPLIVAGAPLRSPFPSSWAVTPLRALYTWSNAIAIPMFCVISGHLSRSLAAACGGDGDPSSLPRRLRKNVESLVFPFLIFQALACAVESASPTLRDALAPGGAGAAPASAASRDDDAAAEARRSFDFWIPHVSWYLVALAMWRGVLPAFAQMRDGAATALALALGVGVGFTNVGAATGYFLKWGTAWGNFPYFFVGAFWCTPERYRVARDAWAGAGQRAAAAATGAVIVGCYMALDRGVVCFDEWQWEAWKSAPFAHGRRDASASALAAAAGFRAATYAGAMIVGGAFLVAIPRGEIPLVSAMGSRTMYGYLLHAPALLTAMAAAGAFERAGRDEGLGAWELTGWGVGAPVLVTIACMTGAARAMFWWLCEPDLGGWLWKRP